MAPVVVRVRPAARLRVPFARWATRQVPKVRTTSPDTFAVPVGLFPAVPEELLAGAEVDGQPYVPAGPAEGVTELVGVEQVAQAGTELLPPLPDSAYPADATPLPDPDPGPEPAEFRCPHCPRTFTTARGRDSHTRRAHTNVEG